MSELYEIFHETWVQGYVFTYPTLVSKSNFRKGDGWKKYADWANDLNQWVDLKMLQQPEWEQVVWCPLNTKLGDRPVTLLSLCSRNMFDSDNSIKSIQDALQGVYYQTDASVRKSSGQTFRQKSDTFADNLVCGVVRLPPEAEASQVYDASVYLDQKVFSRFEVLLSSGD